METFRLERTGDLPVSFQGEKLQESSGRWYHSKDQNRWHDLAIYRTKRGRYLLEIVYRTLWQGEADHNEIIDCGEISSVVMELKRYDPAQHLIGYPPGEQYTERQARLVESLTRRFKDQITELFREIPEAEEKID